MVTEVYLLITVSPGVALVTVAAVLVRGARVVLRNALAPAARLLGAGLDLQLLAVLALVLGGTGALVVPGYGALGAGPAVLTRLVLANSTITDRFALLLSLSRPCLLVLCVLEVLNYFASL